MFGFPEKKLMEEPNLLSTAMIEDLSGKNLLVARNLDYKPILWSINQEINFESGDETLDPSLIHSSLY